MKLIEKKCLNCGAGLEFNENDKSCKCSHCGSSYEIEREEREDELFAHYDLKPIAVASAVSFGAFIPIAIIVIMLVGVIFAHIFINPKSNNKNTFKETEEKYVTKVSELSNADILLIDTTSMMSISKAAEGVNDTNHSYRMTGNPTKEKLYIASKKDGNQIISIYKAIYQDFFHQENTYTVYIPVIFKDVKSEEYFSLGSGKVEAPEYYFNEEKTSYTRGYTSLEEAYNNVVEPLKKEYKISEE